MATLSPVVRHPLTAAVITVLLIITGGVGSVYSPEIRKAYPFTWSRPPWSFSPEATIFWVLAILSTWIFYKRQRADDHARDAAQKVLVERGNTLEQLIRT